MKMEYIILEKKTLINNLMKGTVFFVGLLICVMCSKWAAVKEYAIDLDGPSETRFEQIVKDHLGPLEKACTYYKKEMGPVVWGNISDLFGSVIVLKYPEYASELKGIAKAANMTSPDVFTLNAVYEFIVLCTSIVARDKNDKLILGRNLDLPGAEILRKMHVNIIYKKNGKELFKCGGMPGYIGIFTCMKPGAFAVSLNARDSDSLNGFIERVKGGAKLTTWMFREVMTNAKNYEEAVRMVTSALLTSRVYVTIAGIKPNEGCVITRDSGKTENVWMLSKNTWSLIKCNDDWGVEDNRTDWATKTIEKIGKDKIDLDTIKNQILLKDPIFDSTLTIATVLMSPVDGYLHSIVVDADD